MCLAGSPVTASEHHISALAVIAIAGVDAARQREMMHHLRRMRQEFADSDARHAGGNGTERPAGVSARFRIPTLKLTQAAGHAHDDDSLLILRHLGHRFGRSKRAEPAQHGPGPGCHPADKLSTGNQVLLRATRIITVHR